MPKGKKKVTVVDKTEEPVVLKSLPEPVYVGTLGVLLNELIARHGPVKLEISYPTGSHFSYIVEAAFDDYARCKGGIILSLRNAAYFRVPEKAVLASLMELTSDE